MAPKTYRDLSALGFVRSIFQGRRSRRLPLPGGQDKFSRGVIRQLGPVGVRFPEGSYLENWFRKGDFWCHPLEFLFYQPQK